MANNKKTTGSSATDQPDPFGPLRAQFLEAFNAFVAKAQPLFVPQEDDRLLDQLLVMRDKVFTLLSSEDFHSQLGQALVTKNNTPLLDGEVLMVLVEEMQAFARAVEVYAALNKPEEKKPFLKRLFGFGSTTVGSIKDVVSDNPLVKGGLTVFGELFDLFKG